MVHDAGERPTKRVKTSSTMDEGSGASGRAGGVKSSRQAGKWTAQKMQARKERRGTSRRTGQRDQRWENGAKGSEDEDEEVRIERADVHPKIRTFSRPSVMQVGDKGVFVTSDMGKEKKCLVELLDLVEGYIESRSLDLSSSTRMEQDDEVENEEVKNDDIEADIMAELAAMKPQAQTSAGQGAAKTQSRIHLITLDIPCVSFLRLPPSSPVDPVELVHTICADAARDQNGPRSRFIKRLTPVTILRKSLGGGLEVCCEKALDDVFRIDDPPQTDGEQVSSSGGGQKGFKFAIRPTSRNNDKLDRDTIIRTVADRIHELGKGMHKVDLKRYEIGVLVEVYRGWVSMAVVRNVINAEKGVVEDSEREGYEALKRFNLAEIYAERLKTTEGS